MTRSAKAGALAFALVGLLLVVALASGGGPPTTEGRISSRPVPSALQDSLVTLLAIAYVLAIIAIVVLLFHRRPWHAPEGSRWLRNFVSVMALMLVATVLGYWALTHGRFGQQNEQVQRRQGSGQLQPGQGSPNQPVRTRHAEFQWPLALGIAGLVLLGGVFVVVQRRRTLLAVADGETLERGLARAVETTIDDLRREPDPRRAVIAAYAHMEGALASHGLARRGAETPFEYLARILLELSVRDSAVRSLTRLFEYAKFSPHEIGEDRREEAISALEAVREDLLGEERAAA